MSMLAKVRAAGIRAEIFPDAAKMKKQMSYANAKSVPFVAIVGENEMNEGKAMLKNMGNRRTESCFGGRTDSCFTQLKAGYRVRISAFPVKYLTNDFLCCIFEKRKGINKMNVIRKIDT